MSFCSNMLITRSHIEKRKNYEIYHICWFCVIALFEPEGLDHTQVLRKKDGKAFSLDDLFFILVMSLCIVCGVTYIMPLFDGLLGKCLSVFPLVSLYIVYPVVILYSIFELKEKKAKETNKDEVTEA